MSGETVTSETLQFTNDNKHAYAYSGNIPIPTNSDTTILNFNTNSEYIKSKFVWFGDIAYLSSSKVITFKIKFNDIEVYDNSRLTHSAHSWADQDVIPLIIPPFTNVKAIIYTDDTGERTFGCAVTGKVGMPQRVGNLDE
jgi:hypothetical protein